MSLVAMYESSVRRKKDEISRLKTDRVRYVNIVSDCSKKILSATKQANSTKSASALKSRMNEIERENKKKTEAEKKITEYAKYGILNNHPKNPPLFFRLSILLFI